MRRDDEEEKENNHNTIMYHTVYLDRCKPLFKDKCIIKAIENALQIGNK